MADHALPPAGLSVPPVGEEEVGKARRAEVESLDGGAAGLAQRLLRSSREVEPAGADDIAPEASSKRPRHVLADLVAAGPDRGADRSRHRRPAQRRNPRLHE